MTTPNRPLTEAGEEVLYEWTHNVDAAERLARALPAHEADDAPVHSVCLFEARALIQALRNPTADEG
jgi:hypothetical protein